MIYIMKMSICFSPIFTALVINKNYGIIVKADNGKGVFSVFYKNDSGSWFIFLIILLPLYGPGWGRITASVSDSVTGISFRAQSSIASLIRTYFVASALTLEMPGNVMGKR